MAELEWVWPMPTYCHIVCCRIPWYRLTSRGGQRRKKEGKRRRRRRRRRARIEVGEGKKGGGGRGEVLEHRVCWAMSDRWMGSSRWASTVRLWCGGKMSSEELKALQGKNYQSSSLLKQPDVLFKNIINRLKWGIYISVHTWTGKHWSVYGLVRVKLNSLPGETDGYF